jgi:hypothetical protein
VSHDYWFHPPWDRELFFIDPHLSSLSVTRAYRGAIGVEIAYDGHPLLTPIQSMVFQDRVPGREEIIKQMDESLFYPVSSAVRDRHDAESKAAIEKRRARRVLIIVLQMIGKVPQDGDCKPAAGAVAMAGNVFADPVPAARAASFC